MQGCGSKLTADCVNLKTNIESAKFTLQNIQSVIDKKQQAEQDKASEDSASEDGAGADDDLNDGDDGFNDDDRLTLGKSGRSEKKDEGGGETITYVAIVGAVVVIIALGSAFVYVLQKRQASLLCPHATVFAHR